MHSTKKKSKAVFDCSGVILVYQLTRICLNDFYSPFSSPQWHCFILQYWYYTFFFNHRQPRHESGKPTNWRKENLIEAQKWHKPKLAFKLLLKDLVVKVDHSEYFLFFNVHLYRERTQLWYSMARSHNGLVDWWFRGGDPSCWKRAT